MRRFRCDECPSEREYDDDIEHRACDDCAFGIMYPAAPPGQGSLLFDLPAPESPRKKETFQLTGGIAPMLTGPDEGEPF